MQIVQVRQQLMSRYGVCEEQSGFWNPLMLVSEVMLQQTQVATVSAHIQSVAKTNAR